MKNSKIWNSYSYGESIPYPKENENEKYIAENLEDVELSILSNSLYDSLEHLKYEKIGQYTCDECSEIPKIININKEQNLFQ